MNTESPDFYRLSAPQTREFLFGIGIDPYRMAAWVDGLTHTHVPEPLAGPRHPSRSNGPVTRS